MSIWFSRQEVYVVVRRKKLTVFLDATETTPFLEINKQLSAILKREVEDMKLYRHKRVG